MKKLHVVPAAPAAIMAIGIFLIGTIERFPVLDKSAGPILAAIVIFIWLCIYAMLIIQMTGSAFRHSLLASPVKFFAVGTWIAAVSVLCNVALKYYPALHPLIRIAAVINIACWVVFAVFAIFNFRKLVHIRGQGVHGIILLAAVCTQSTIIMSRAAFVSVPNWLITAWIGLGFCFYFLGIILLAIRYGRQKDWEITTDWTNTNCIIHGALSISGVAMAVSGLFSSLAVVACWVTAFALLIFVESIECVRAVKRVQAFGFKQGLLSYDVSQWARNFTFGMFFLLSRHAMTRLSGSVPVNLYSVLEQFISVWAGIVIFFLTVEIAIAFFSVSQKIRHKNKKAKCSV